MCKVVLTANGHPDNTAKFERDDEANTLAGRAGTGGMGAAPQPGAAGRCDSAGPP